MSKRKGPFLITDLDSKLKSAPSPVRSPKVEADTTHAQNAYGFIAANYQQEVSNPNKSGSTPSSSSSSIDLENFKTTTTDESELFENTPTQLSPEWQAVDVAPLAEFGFTQTHLVQIIRQGKLQPSEVQDSIYFFAFDLKRNGKEREIKGPPVNFFMGILRKGLPYAPPENYESPEQAARRAYLDGKRRMEEQRFAEERELRDLEFAEWRRGLTREQIADIVPDVVRDIAPARDSSLKAHFDEQVWPMRCSEIPGRVDVEHEQIRQQIDKSLGEVRG